MECQLERDTVEQLRYTNGAVRREFRHAMVAKIRARTAAVHAVVLGTSVKKSMAAAAAFKASNFIENLEERVGSCKCTNITSSSKSKTRIAIGRPCRAAPANTLYLPSSSEDR